MVHSHSLQGHVCAGTRAVIGPDMYLCHSYPLAGPERQREKVREREHINQYLPDFHD